MTERPTLTTTAGAPVADSQNSITAGPRGPLLMEDYQTWNITVCLPRLQVPGVNNIGPFVQKKFRVESGCASALRGLSEHCANYIVRRNRRSAEALCVKPACQIVDRLHGDTGSDSRLIADEMTQVGTQRVGERRRKRREKHSRFGRRRASCTARCSATIVLPVPADPETRAGPRKIVRPGRADRDAERRPISPTEIRGRAPVRGRRNKFRVTGSAGGRYLIAPYLLRAGELA